MTFGEGKKSISTVTQTSLAVVTIYCLHMCFREMD